MSIYALPRCRDCGMQMTLEEEHWYEYRCEKCEAKWFERVQAWKRGELEDDAPWQNTPGWGKWG